MTPLCTGRVSLQPRSLMPLRRRTSSPSLSNAIGAGSNNAASYASVDGASGTAGDGRVLRRRDGARWLRCFCEGAVVGVVKPQAQGRHQSHRRGDGRGAPGRLLHLRRDADDDSGRLGPDVRSAQHRPRHRRAPTRSAAAVRTSRPAADVAASGSRSKTATSSRTRRCSHRAAPLGGSSTTGTAAAGESRRACSRDTP